MPHTSIVSRAVLCKCAQARDILHKSVVFSHACLNYFHIPCSDGCFTCYNICVILESACCPGNVVVLCTIWCYSVTDHVIVNTFRCSVFFRCHFEKNNCTMIINIVLSYFIYWLKLKKWLSRLYNQVWGVWKYICRRNI